MKDTIKKLIRRVRFALNMFYVNLLIVMYQAIFGKKKIKKNV